MPAIVPGLTLRVESDVIAASLTIDLPTGYAVDDYFFVFVAQDTGTTAITTASSGWVAVGTYAASQACGSRWFYKRITSTSETPPTFNGTNDDWGYVVHVVRGVNHANVLNAVDRTDWGNGTTVHQFTTGTPTTTVNNCLCLVGICGDNNVQLFQDPTLFPIAAGNSSNAICFFTGYFNQYTAGTTPAKTMYADQADEGGNAWTICIEDNGSGRMSPDPGTATQLIDYHQINTGRTFTAPNTEFTVIDSQGVDTAVTVSFTAVNGDPGRWSSYTTFNSTLSSLDWAGGVHVLPSAIDLTNAVYSVIWRISSTAQMGTKGLIVVFKDGAGAWAAFQLSKRAGLNILPSYYTSHIALGSATPLDSSGSINWANITKIAYLYQRNNSATGMTIQIFNAAFTRKDCAITGGSLVDPVTTATPALLALGTNRSGFDKAGLQGRKQYLMKQHIQFGDGSRATYVDLDGCSIETPQAYSYTAGRRYWNVLDDFLTMTIKSSAGCTMKLRNCVIAPSVRVNAVIDPASSTSASYDFSGSSWSNVNFVSKTGITVNSAIFAGNPEIDAKGGTFSGCLFSNSQSANAAIKLDAGASLLSCQFTAKNASDYAVRIPAAGTYTLDGTTFSGFTTAINITATTGTVTLHLALGQTIPTYTSAGATVVIDQPTVSATVSVTGMVANSRLRIYNVTTATEKVNAVQAGTSYSLSYSDGTEYTAGDIIKVRVTAPATTTAYNEVEYTAVATASGWSVLVEQTADDEYNAAGIDGTTVTEFSGDYPNIQVDISDPDGVTTLQRMHAWWMANLYTANGIRNFFGGLMTEDAINFRIVTAKLNLKLDNVSGSPVVITGGRLYRDDGTTVIAATSGSIQLDPGKAYAVETGTSGLTPAESAKLLSLDTSAVNVATINGAQVIGTGTLGDAWRGLGVTP